MKKHVFILAPMLLLAACSSTPVTDPVMDDSDKNVKNIMMDDSSAMMDNSSAMMDDGMMKSDSSAMMDSSMMNNDGPVQ